MCSSCTFPAEAFHNSFSLFSTFKRHSTILWPSVSGWWVSSRLLLEWSQHINIYNDTTPYVWCTYDDRNCSHCGRWAIAAFYSIQTHLDFSGSEKCKMPIKNKHSILRRRRFGEVIIRTERTSRFSKSQLSLWTICCFLQISVFLWKDYSIVGD